MVELKMKSKSIGRFWIFC